MPARCRHAVMTRAADADDLGVVDGERGYPRVRIMAVLADVTGLNMSRILASRIHTIVAAEAIAGNVHVVEVGRQPARRRMAVVAIVAARDVCRMFAGRRHAVVAGAAGSEHLGVIDGKHWREYVRRMTVFTDIGRLHVRRALARCFHAVVTAEAIAGDVHMIEVGR